LNEFNIYRHCSNLQHTSTYTIRIT